MYLVAGVKDDQITIWDGKYAGSWKKMDEDMFFALRYALIAYYVRAPEQSLFEEEFPLYYVFEIDGREIAHTAAHAAFSYGSSAADNAERKFNMGEAFWPWVDDIHPVIYAMTEDREELFAYLEEIGFEWITEIDNTIPF